ncbi:MAG: galactose oxidase-like domain-containing protein, partial [Pseudonocardiaceae bacterium]
SVLDWLVEDETMAPESAEDSTSAHLGRWDPVFELPNVAIHTNVLPNGKVLFWGRRDHPTGSLHEHECTPHIWDPRTGELTPTPQPKLADGTKINLFCAGHAFLADGRLLVAGGHLTDGDGLNQACIYDYRTNTWTALPVMNKRRWYPTVTALSDGTMLVLSGSYIENGRFIINDVPQIWDGQQWTPTVDFIGLPLYPHMHVAPDGRVFMAGSNAKTYLLNTEGTGTWTPLPEPGGVRRNGERQYGPSVMYDAGKVVYIGGGNDGPTAFPTAAAEVIDLGAHPPEWREVASMRFPRRQHNAAILADGSVLVTGGTRGPGFNDLSPGKPVHVAELWDPVTAEWKELAAEDVDRCYHGTAVLLPDATVLSAGSGEFDVGGGQPNDPRDSHRDAQIFHPPYLFQGPRPVITAAPEEISYGETFSLEISGSDVGKVTWIRLPSVTHAFDQNQRVNVLEFSFDGGSLTVTAPARPEICPPGHYMLFVLSKAGVPSLARIARIGPSAPQARAAVSPALAEASLPTSPGTTTRTQELDETVRTQSTGTRVTVGLTAKCPYGLGACWGGAYEALKKLGGVAAVRPIANAEHSTADVYLRDQGLPDLDGWPEQIARWANGSYDFRGVEVTVTGTLGEHDGMLQLTGPSFDAPVSLMPLSEGTKLQWDYQTRSVRDTTRDERDAYQNLTGRYQELRGGDEPTRVTGPLARTGNGWVLYVRKFETQPPVNA